MRSNFPNSLDIFTVKQDDIDDVLAEHFNRLQDAIVAVESKIGIGSYSVSLHYLVNNFIVYGRKVFSYKNTCATGWVSVGVSDVVLAVKGGTGSYNVSGGVTAGTAWSVLGTHVHNLNGHDHSVTQHLHHFYGNQQSYDSGGSLQTMISGGALGFGNYFGGCSTCKSPYYYYRPGQLYSEYKTEDIVSKSTNTGASSVSEPRPTAALGMIIQKE